MTSTNETTPQDHPDLREALKRCSPATYYAACKFRQTGEAEHLQVVILGVVERYVERDLRPKLQSPDPDLRLREDLGLDSLTMMEIVMVAEEVLPISITNEELTRLRTLGEVQAFFFQKMSAARQTSTAKAEMPCPASSDPALAVYGAPGALPALPTTVHQPGA